MKNNRNSIDLSDSVILGGMDDAAPPQDRPMTAPEAISISLRAFENEEQARDFGNLIAAYVRELSRHVDLSDLAGLTVAFDYAEALRELDRGYETTSRLTPSAELIEGVAMTPAVIRDGKLKSHIVMNAAYVMPLADTAHGDFLLALHVLAHECAHVEVTKVFEAAFPNTRLGEVFDTYVDANRWQVILACWDEYAATRISAPFGRDPTADYESTFILFLDRSRDKANEFIKAYRLHGDLERIVGEVYGVYGNLMKFACYHLGNMAGRGLTLDDLPVTRAVLKESWFARHWVGLEEACSGIWDAYGVWPSRQPFEVIGAIADAVLLEGGMVVRQLSPGSYHVDIPLIPQTVPISAA